MSDVLYRKYRPQTFGAIKGQDHVVALLQNQIKNKQPAHSYLFVGGRGLGKTSIARIFAKELGIHKDDIFEFDAASYRKLENAKELKETISSLPLFSEYKMYIIDEAHMLTKEAWNSLLKSIEEPPKHVIFVFATTEKHKVLPTIISRCVVCDFKIPNIETIKELVIEVAQQESIVISNDEALYIARKAQGSFRDALSILEGYKFGGAQDASITYAYATKFLNSLETPSEAVTLVRSIDASTLDYFIDVLIHVVQEILLLRFDKKFISNISQQISEDDFNVALHNKMINAKMLSSLIELATQCKHTSYKHECIIAWLLQIIENKSV